MKRLKYTATGFFLFFAFITDAIPALSLAGGLIDMGYGRRGGSMSSGAARSKGPIQPIPVNYDHDRPKIELGKKLLTKQTRSSHFSVP